MEEQNKATESNVISDLIVGNESDLMKIEFDNSIKQAVLLDKITTLEEKHLNIMNGLTNTFDNKTAITNDKIEKTTCEIESKIQELLDCIRQVEEDTNNKNEKIKLEEHNAISKYKKQNKLDQKNNVNYIDTLEKNINDRLKGINDSFVKNRELNQIERDKLDDSHQRYIKKMNRNAQKFIKEYDAKYALILEKYNKEKEKNDKAYQEESQTLENGELSAKSLKSKKVKLEKEYKKKNELLQKSTNEHIAKINDEYINKKTELAHTFNEKTKEFINKMELMKLSYEALDIHNEFDGSTLKETTDIEILDLKKTNYELKIYEELRILELTIQAERDIMKNNKVLYTANIDSENKINKLRSDLLIKCKKLEQQKDLTALHHRHKSMITKAHHQIKIATMKMTFLEQEQNKRMQLMEKKKLLLANQKNSELEKNTKLVMKHYDKVLKNSEKKMKLLEKMIQDQKAITQLEYEMDLEIFTNDFVVQPTEASQARYEKKMNSIEENHQKSLLKLDNQMEMHLTKLDKLRVSITSKCDKTIEEYRKFFEKEITLLDNDYEKTKDHYQLFYHQKIEELSDIISNNQMLLEEMNTQNDNVKEEYDQIYLELVESEKKKLDESMFKNKILREDYNIDYQDLYKEKNIILRLKKEDLKVFVQEYVNENKEYYVLPKDIIKEEQKYQKSNLKRAAKKHEQTVHQLCNENDILTEKSIQQFKGYKFV